MKISIDFPDRKIRAMLKRLMEAGLQAADPMLAMKKAMNVNGPTLQVGGRQYNLKKFDRILCLGAGKASGRMALVLEQQLSNHLSDGLVVVNNCSGCRTKKIHLLEAEPDS